jgi:hypothetical protein
MTEYYNLQSSLINFFANDTYLAFVNDYEKNNTDSAYDVSLVINTNPLYNGYLDFTISNLDVPIFKWNLFDKSVLYGRFEFASGILRDSSFIQKILLLVGLGVKVIINGITVPVIAPFVALSAIIGLSNM